MASFRDAPMSPGGTEPLSGLPRRAGGALGAHVPVGWMRPRSCRPPFHQGCVWLKGKTGEGIRASLTTAQSGEQKSEQSKGSAFPNQETRQLFAGGLAF